MDRMDWDGPPPDAHVEQADEMQQAQQDYLTYLAAQERDVERARDRVISLAAARRKREAKLLRTLKADVGYLGAA